jgi:hypothetical protein
MVWDKMPVPMLIGSKCVPIKDLVGSPHPTPEQKALLEEVLTRCGLPLPKRSGWGGDDGLEPASLPRDPTPSPISGGAEAVLPSDCFQGRCKSS